MKSSFLEHVNFTVSDPAKTAKEICEIYGWKIRWQGSSIFNGHTVHVGNDTSYVALYSMGHGIPKENRRNYHMVGGLNHVAIVVDDLGQAERRVKVQGFKTHSHADCEPGKRFYYHDGDGIEFEVVSYSDNKLA
jgi:catechol 2,3-dioxygenase-like lactoylglutathione lyase family enzyme